MILKDLASGLQLLPGAIPICHKGNGKRVILVIHGFTGYPGEYRYFADFMHQKGFDVCVPRLPGHGTSLDDFLKSNAEDWLRKSVDTYLELKARYEEVIVCGLSMGGVIASIVSSFFQPAKTILLAPAFRTTSPFLPYARFISLFLKKTRNAWSADEETEEERLRLGKIYWEYYPLRELIQLNKLIRLGRSRLTKMESSILIIVSEQDRTVPASVGKFLVKRLVNAETKLITLEKSGHVLVRGVEKERVVEECLAWI